MAQFYVVTEKDVNELLIKYTKKEFLDMIDFESEFLDYRSKVIVANIHIERLMEFIIIKKSKEYVDFTMLSFSQKQKILFEFRIFDDYLNHELKIINQIRNTFAHEVNPIGDKISQLIKKFKFYDETKMPKDDNPISQSGKDGMIVGMITGILMRQLVEILWDTDTC